jgi:hypothetical protein
MGEGRISWGGQRTWYRVAGDLDATDKLPLAACTPAWLRSSRCFSDCPERDEA